MSLLRFPAARRFASLFCVALLIVQSGCASRASKPPPDPVRPLARITLLPVVPPHLDSDAAATHPGNPGYLGSSGVSGGGISPGAAIATVGVALISYAIVDARRKEKARLADAVAAIRFDPAARLNERLQRRLEEAGLVVQRVPDDAARQLRDSDDYKSLAAQADAVLDVQVDDDFGYYDAGRTGLSPRIEISASLATTNTNNEPESYDYGADARTKPKDPRWVTTPATFNYADIDALAGHPDAARAALEATLDRIVDKLVDDVKRRAAAQPRL